MDTVDKDYRESGQEHVLEWRDKLQQADKSRLDHLNGQINAIDVRSLTQKYQEALHTAQTTKRMSAGDVEPLPHISILALTPPDVRKRWEASGYEHIAKGHVAALVLAGGQGTRLGASEPKGTYDVCLPSHKSLFQIQAERLLKLQALTASKQNQEKVAIRWYIMTSPATDKSTRDFFTRNQFFGLQESQVVFFQQGLLPCLSQEGKILMESKYNIATAPNGNGGLYKALETEGILEDMRKHGVEYLLQYCVDNILIRPCDPVWVGFLYEKQADCSAKVCAKASAEEAVGVLCMREGKPGVVEYSEIDKELAAVRVDSADPKSPLRFNAAHLCINAFRRDFLEKAAQEYAAKMPYHMALKKIPCADAQGETQQPAAPNGWKLELFIFDVFQFAQNMAALEVRRDEEFAPLKNIVGSFKDSEETCRYALYRLHQRYIQDAGGIIENANAGPSGPNGTITPEDCRAVQPCEIAASLSFAGEGLLSRCMGKTFSLPLHLSAAY